MLGLTISPWNMSAGCHPCLLHPMNARCLRMTWEFNSHKRFQNSEVSEFFWGKKAKRNNAGRSSFPTGIANASVERTNPEDKLTGLLLSCQRRKIYFCRFIFLFVGAFLSQGQLCVMAEVSLMCGRLVLSNETWHTVLVCVSVVSESSCSVQSGHFVQSLLFL